MYPRIPLQVHSWSVGLSRAYHNRMQTVLMAVCLTEILSQAFALPIAASQLHGIQISAVFFFNKLLINSSVDFAAAEIEVSLCSLFAGQL